METVGDVGLLLRQEKTGNRYEVLFPVFKPSSAGSFLTVRPGPEYSDFDGYGRSTAQEMTVVQRPFSPSADWVILYELMIFPLIL